jgi:ligand-binding sensor domain-containing protein
VGTNGGGIVRRASDGRYEPYVETEGLKVSPGCLTRAGGRLYAGTDGRGLWRLSGDGSRFEPLHVDLPSPRVTALLASPDALLVGTDEGLARMPLEGGAEGSGGTP